MHKRCKNYTPQDIALIKERQAIMTDNIAEIEMVAKLLDREPWSIYQHVYRKNAYDLFVSIPVKREFMKKYAPDTYQEPKRQFIEDPPISKNIIRFKNVVHDDPPKKIEKRPPAKYSNFDHRAWAMSLLDD